MARASRMTHRYPITDDSGCYDASAPITVPGGAGAVFIK